MNTISLEQIAEEMHEICERDYENGIDTDWLILAHRLAVKYGVCPDDVWQQFYKDWC